jgi:hypothetical protein
MSGSVVIEEARERFERLMDAVEFGKVVPFLGAGISTTATAPVGNGLGEKMHGASIARKLMLQILKDCWTADGQVDKHWWGFVKADLKLSNATADLAGNPPEVPEDSNLLAIVEQKIKAAWERAAHPSRRNPSIVKSDIARLACVVQAGIDNASSPLARLSELVAMRRGYVELCNILHMDRFTELQPTPAHTAIARLVIEGAFSEVITTNYDLCLERALAKELGAHDKSGSSAANEGILAQEARGILEDHLDVVDRAIHYMGATNKDRRTQRRRARYYKINGCAGAWRIAKKKAESPPAGEDPVRLKKAAWNQAQRMILTERQLQTFRGERWAEEMFRDRARGSHLLFCGFGNEEPQIRHTALAIMREFESMTTEEDESSPQGGDLWNLGAAPWFHQFGDQLQFFQMQILHGWKHAWQPEPGDPTSKTNDTATKADGASPVWQPPANAFTKADRMFFGLKTSEAGLTADAFWEAILLNWWKRKYMEAWGCRNEEAPRNPLHYPGILGELQENSLGSGASDQALLLVKQSARRLFDSDDSNQTNLNAAKSRLNQIQEVVRMLYGHNPERYLPIAGSFSRGVALCGFLILACDAAKESNSEHLNGLEISSDPSACCIRLSWPSGMLTEAIEEDSAPTGYPPDTLNIFVPGHLKDVTSGRSGFIAQRVELTAVLALLFREAGAADTADPAFISCFKAIIHHARRARNEYRPSPPAVTPRGWSVASEFVDEGEYE